MKKFRMIKGEKVEVLGDSWAKYVNIKIKADSDIFVPSFEIKDSAGADLKSSEDLILEPMKVRMIDAGFSCQIPENYHAKICARSSMGKKGIIIPNSPGIVDAGYLGRICVLLLNLSNEPYEIRRGDRIAQWILEHNTSYSFEAVTEFGKTERGEGGFGSSGR
jgi:dUTP pyrophosphatase